MASVESSNPFIRSPAIPPMTAGDKANLVGVVAPVLFLIISSSLALYFGLHPIGPMVQLASNASLSLPCLICSSAGGLAAFMFTIQLCRRRALSKAGAAARSSLIRYAFHSGRDSKIIPKDQMDRENKPWVRDAIDEKKEIGATRRVTYEARAVEASDGQKIEAASLSGFWYKQENPYSPTMIVFHGIGNVADNFGALLDFYARRGFNVLLAESRGQGFSESCSIAANREIEAYLDAEAAFKFVLEQGVDRKWVCAHGYSMGAAYAASLTAFFDVKYLILERTFSNLPAAIQCHIPFVSEDFVSQLFDSSFNQWIIPPHPDDLLDAKVPLKTSNFNVGGMVSQRAKGQVYVIAGRNDWVVGKSGEKIISKKGEDKLFIVDGGHSYENYLNVYPVLNDYVETFYSTEQK
jgi:hypothetical protein